MTKVELIRKLATMKEAIGHDPETAHKFADEYLLEFINDKDITKAFNNIRKWYS